MPHKLRQYARGKPCMIRVPGVCNGNPETTVLCHLNGAGMGMKHHDLLGAWGCSSCHDWVDGRVACVRSDVRRLALYEAVIRTQQMLIEEGKVVIK